MVHLLKPPASASQGRAIAPSDPPCVNYGAAQLGGTLGVAVTRVCLS